MTPEGLVEVASRHGAEETMARLKAAVAAHGMTVMAAIDHAAAAREAGLALRPTVVLIFGNARAGTPLMAMSEDDRPRPAAARAGPREGGWHDLAGLHRPGGDGGTAWDQRGAATGGDGERAGGGDGRGGELRAAFPHPLFFVIPAEAGIQLPVPWPGRRPPGFPAYAGMRG